MVLVSCMILGDHLIQGYVTLRVCLLRVKSHTLKITRRIGKVTLWLEALEG